MTDPETGAPSVGPPARPPGPIPAGYVPRELLQQHAPPAPPPIPGSSVLSDAALPEVPGVAPPVGPPFLDTPWVPPKTPRQAWYWLLFAVGGFVVGQLAAGVFAFVAGAVAGKTVAQTEALA
ncbi:MAG TPA: hypothetical protein VHZ05_10430, partial [Acidimicrobiales bacterium]|nr:hypothetical protein [Acidimicrobiales bacterium]